MAFKNELLKDPNIIGVAPQRMAAVGELWQN